MRLPIACVLIAGGAIALTMPLGEAEMAMSGEMEAKGDGVTLGAVQSATGPSGWGGEVTLSREYDGHFYADVYVDGVPSRMLVDTGASVIALTGDDAHAMGIYWDDAEVMPVAQGASGTVYGVRAHLPRVRVGEFEATNVEAIIVPQGLGISLLGQSFLSTIGDVRIADDRMVLGSR
ncbi:retropepsin-like aspartic protease family protein [Aurantiacibacter gangjinensis]|nr:TIGR02281 family clan AA aspartic protease [Aurantiacibacter gangjinensis]